MSKRRCSVFHEDTIEKLLDRVSYMREELIAIERSLERMQIAKLARGKVLVAKSPPYPFSEFHGGNQQQENC